LLALAVTTGWPIIVINAAARHTELYAPSTGCAACVTRIVMGFLSRMRHAIATGPLPPSTTKPAMSNKEIEDKKTINARDKGFFGMSM
jgi:hypothetical protein